ncbi:fasciclin domain-containing protein [Mucilaginibacter auburnensis]|uniref:Putative surface protein with fasciclin (FAS1) repeats n=1 Tax=Mucilaginibacter auburnensis TaxID=1457233 RepID=A0A2H9VQX6_9SPHI|nr:fasciclin domain-containing protein [Mucilaginibacter auburnensis]PJJ83220.1 putative surface protein with fasciclin (FAS1) repeats [Mucilaginibacter auburnensis]
MRKFLFIAAVATSAVYFAPAKANAQATDTTKTSTPATAPSLATTPATPTKDVAETVASNTDYTTAATAIKTAGLEASLKAAGPFTIFAPNEAAFSKLPAGTVDSLKKDPAKLGALLKGHVVTGKYGKAEIIKALTEGKGKATLTTIDGQSLTLSVSPNKTLQLTNAAGSMAEVSLYDLWATNGVVNGINSVLK